MKEHATLAFLAISFGIVLPTNAQSVQSITLDGSGTGKIFQGLGGVSAGGSSRLLIDYPEPYRSQILDYLFKPNYGASLQHLKVEIGGDMNSTSGAEPSHMHSSTDQNYTRGYEWWLMQQAKLRNPNITLEALAWGAPGWIGNGNFFSQDNINYILNFIQGAKSTYGLTIDEVGIWNETSFDPYWIINLKAALQQAGLSTKIVAADQGASNTTIVSDMSTISALDSAVDIIGMHYTDGNGEPISQPLNGQPVWDTEEGPWRGDWTGAMYLARAYNLNYATLKITLTEVWSLVTSYYDILPIPGSGMMYANTPWSGNYDVQPAIWATAHTTQFAQPGWQYLDAASGSLSGGSFVTLKNGTDYSVILETTQAQNSQTLTFNIAGGLSTGTVHVWESNSVSQFVQQSDITPVNGSFTIALAPGAIYSLTTTTGQSKGNATPPSASAFPLPYIDTFDSYLPGQEAQYFSTINGSFETAACGGGRSGLCLRQAVNAPPIPWSLVGPIEPGSIVGSASWANYQVSADVFLEQTGTVKLIGRFTGYDINSGNVLAYQFYVASTGNWVLCHRDSDVLSSGTASFSPNAWHTLKLIFNGTQIQGLIDGVQVTSVTDGGFATGMAGVGVQGWTNAQFDNFAVEPLPGATLTVPQYQMTATATSQTSGNEAGKAIDGDTSTFWISAFSCSAGCTPTVPLPQSVTLALGGAYNVNALSYLPRQDGNANGTITNYNIYLSSDGVNFTNVASGNWGADSTQKSASFTQTSASFIRLEAVAAAGGYASASEINVEYSSASTGGNPLPILTGISPSSLASGGGGFTLSVNGSNFGGDSTVLWNGSGRPTTFISSTSLAASIAASDVIATGTTSVMVFNPSPGGGVSNTETFSISNIQYLLTSNISPAGGGTVTASLPSAAGYYYSGTSVQLTAAPAAGCSFQNWSGALSGATNPQPVTMSTPQTVTANFQCTTKPPAPTTFLTGYALNGPSLRNDFTGWVGMKLTVGTAPLSVSALGRLCVANNSQTHTVKFVNAGNGGDVTGASASVNLAGCTTGQFVYSSISPVTLSAGASYYIASQETLGGDRWYDQGTISAKTDAAVNGAIYAWNGSWYAGGSANTTYVPPNFQYSVVTLAPIPVTVQASPAGPSFTVDGNVSTTSQTLTWTSGTSHTIATTSPQSVGAGIQYAWSSWSDGGSISHTVAPTSGTTYTASFATQYLLTTSVSPAGAGSVTAGAYYNSGTPVTLTATSAANCAFSSWSGNLTGSTNPASITMSAPQTVTATFQCTTPPPSSTAFVTGYALNGPSPRNDFTGWVGMKLTVGATPLSVSALGRICLAGNALTHTAKFVNVSNGSDVPGTSVLLNMAGCTAGQFAYSSISPVTLSAGASYYLVTQETQAGDRWYDQGTISTNTDAAVNGAIYSWNGSWYAGGSVNTSYVPPNFQYSTGGAAPPQYQLTTSASPAGSGSVSVGGYYSSGTSVTLTATPAANCAFSSWSGNLTGSANPTSITMSAPQTVTANFQCTTTPPASTPFLTGYALNGPSLRNDFAGWVGMKLTVGVAPLSVSALGRVCVPGNALTHTVKFVNAATGSDVAGASVSLNMAGCTAGQFAYQSISPVILPAGASYYLVTQETQGGDRWYDQGTVSTTTAGAVNNAIYVWNGIWYLASSASSYVPPNFQYSVTGP